MHLIIFLSLLVSCLIHSVVPAPTSHNNTLIARAEKTYNQDCPKNFCDGGKCPDDYYGPHHYGDGVKLHHGYDDHVSRPIKSGRLWKCWDEVWVTEKSLWYDLTSMLLQRSTEAE